MSVFATGAVLMARKAQQKTTPVRLSDEAIRWARIASGYTAESMSEYVSRTVVERAKLDADRLHAETVGEGGRGLVPPRTIAERIVTPAVVTEPARTEPPPPPKRGPGRPPKGGKGS